MTATASSPLVRAPTRDAVMAQAGSENFPVALRLLGARWRADLLAIYGFARLVDDAGDEAAGDRLALLDWIEHDLDRIYAHQTPEHPVNRALQPVIAERRLPAAPFKRLIDANRQDQHVTRYQTFDQLLGYCELSAAPVGELVLHVFGAATAERIALSDKVCAGLQVTEHIQDVSEDLARGRVYLPAEDLARFGVDDLSKPPEGFRSVIAFEVRRARTLLAEGSRLIRTLSGRPALAVAGFVAGGRAALSAIERADYDVLTTRPRPSRMGLAVELIRSTPWR
jgi:squalene synthase HpnC